MARVFKRGVSVTMNRELIDITSERETPNEQWKHIDRQGHEHYYEHGYPTLRLVVDRSHLCDGTEGWTLHEPHWFIDESHYDCKICHQTIKPATNPPYTPKVMPGMISGTAEGVRSDGAIVIVDLTEAEMAEIEEAGDRHQEVAQRIIDTSDRIISMTMSG